MTPAAVPGQYAQAQAPLVLLYGEDPGAANFLCGVPAGLETRGARAALYTSGAATAYLAQDGETPAQLPSGDVAALVAELDPALVAVGTSENPDSPALALIDAARARGVATAGLVDHDAHAGLRFRGRSDDPLAHAPDRLLVPDSATAAAFAQLGFPADAIVTCGHPRLDRARLRRQAFDTRGRKALRAEILPRAGRRPVAVFLAEQAFSLDPAAPETADPEAFPGRGPGRDRVGAVFEAFLDACAGLPEPPFVVLRLHPKNHPAEFDAWSDDIDMLSTGGDALPLLYCADAVVGLTTLLLAEADALGARVIAAPARAEEIDWLPASLRGSPRIARDGAALANLLVSALADGRDEDTSVRTAPATACAVICDTLAALAGTDRAAQETLR